MVDQQSSYAIEVPAMSNSLTLALVAALFFAAPLAARDFSGFFTPEFVKDHDPPYIPVNLMIERVSARFLPSTP